MKWLFLILFITFPPKEKEVIWRTAQTYDNGLCSDQIIFYKDHFLIYHIGCEANNSLRFATWKQVKDSVEIIYSDTLNFELIKSVNIKNYSESKDSVLLRVVDCYKRPIRDVLFYGFPKGMNPESKKRINDILILSKKLPRFYLEQFYQEDSLLELKLYETNEDGTFFAKKSEIYSIQLVLSNQLSINPIRVNLFGMQKEVNIQTTIPAEAFDYPLNKWIYFPLKSKFHINDLKKP